MPDLLGLVCDVYCDFVTFPFGIVGQVWYLIVSIPNPCCLSYFGIPVILIIRLFRVSRNLLIDNTLHQMISTTLYRYDVKAYLDFWQSTQGSRWM